ncbi:MAG: dihydroorotase, partial [Roseiflexus sp.]|nr:dihydroorotase [Roseiflexus sp.]
MSAPDEQICTLISPLDMHIHFREGAMLRTVAPLSARDFAGGVIMPNLVPPVDNLERLLRYRAEIEAAISGMGFTPY